MCSFSECMHCCDCDSDRATGSLVHFAHVWPEWHNSQRLTSSHECIVFPFRIDLYGGWRLRRGWIEPIVATRFNLKHYIMAKRKGPQFISIREFAVNACFWLNRWITYQKYSCENSTQISFSEIQLKKNKLKKMSKIKFVRKVTIVLMGVFGLCLSAEFMEEKGKCFRKKKEIFILARHGWRSLQNIAIFQMWAMHFYDHQKFGVKTRVNLRTCTPRDFALSAISR